MTTLLFFLMLSASLLAGTDKPVALDVDLTSGPVTVQCSYVDLSAWGGVFRFVAPSFHCLLGTTSSDVAEFSVTVSTRDNAGNAHLYTTRTAAVNGHSIVAFPTKDTVLEWVSVSEVKVAVMFDGSQQ